MANPITLQQLRSLRPGQLVTLAPGRGPMGRQAFVAKVHRVAPAPSEAVYLKTPRAGREVRLLPAITGAAWCDRFRVPNGRPGEWQLTLGYDTEFLSTEV